MKTTFLFQEIKESLTDGDQLVTEVNWNKRKRTVVYTNGGVSIGSYWFHWDYFFEVNTPIKKL